MTVQIERRVFQHPDKNTVGETNRQEIESIGSSFPEGGALGSKTSDDGQMADEKSRRHDCLP
jgi:hypothetical protein